MKKVIKRLLDNYLIQKEQMRISVEPKKNLINLIRRLHPVKISEKLIRLGPIRDGGYLIPNDLEGIEACFSPGVYEITQFEYDCYNKGLKLFLADKSISKPKINIPEDKYEFIQKYIGVTDNSEFMTLDTWVKNSKLSKDGDLLLQMDIEGWEYLSIINTSNDLLKRFRIIIVEFHNLQQLWIPSFFSLVNAALNKLLETHSCVHVHPNNDSPIYNFNGIEIPPLIEITFYRNDRMVPSGFVDKFPNELDHDNVVQNPGIILPSIWYNSDKK